jgi:hypothetical protein
MWFARGWDAALTEVEEGSDTMTREPETDGLYQRAQTRATPLLTKLADFSDQEWAELTHRMRKHFEREMHARGLTLTPEDETWNAALAAVEEAVGEHVPEVDRWTIAQAGVGHALHDPSMFVGSRVRNEADAALIVEAVNAYDRLKRIEAAMSTLRARIEALPRWPVYADEGEPPVYGRLLNLDDVLALLDPAATEPEETPR